MAENINISFAPNKNADESQRIADIENYLQTLTERTKFALSTIIENYNETDDNKTSQLKQNIALQSVSDSVRVSDSVGKFTNTDKTSEIFNDYSGNTAHGKYSHVEGYNNRMDSEGAIFSWATHIEGQGNAEASRTSCPLDKKASNNHIEGKSNRSYGRINHVEGVNCFAEYNTQNCHVEGSNCRVSEGARVAHVEGKDCVAGNECSHAEGKSAQATGYASHAEGESCIASGNYSHSGGLSSEASGKCSYTGGELGTASGDYSHTEGLSNTASGAYSYALGKNNTAIGEYSVASGVESTTRGGYAIAHGYKCSASDDSIAIGIQSQATNNSFAFGTGLNAYGLDTVAFGRYNKETHARFVIGGGTANDPFDVLWIDRECNLHVAGKVIANGGAGYVLPTATADTLGGVMIGDNIAVADDGTISVDLSAYLQTADIADWAKQPEKPVYTADEVGAAAEQHTHSTADITDFPAIPTKVSDLQNDSGYISGEIDPTVPAWAKADTKPTYTASEVGAATADDISAAINAVEVGGRNYLLNTKTFSAASSTSLSGALLSGAANLSEETYYGLSVRGGTLTTTQMDICRYGFKFFNLGDTFTFSFFARGNITELRVYFYGTTGYVQVAKSVNSQGESNTNVDGRCSFAVTDDWKRYWVRWTLKTTGDTTIPKWILIRAYNSQVGQEIYVCGCKLEKGNVNTDWSPDPEDYFSLAERVSALEAAALAGGE